MKTHELNIDVTFTPRAHALLAGQRFALTQHHQFALRCAQWDLVEFPNVRSTFVVFVRKWTVRDESETLTVVLDIADEKQALLMLP